MLFTGLTSRQTTTATTSPVIPLERLKAHDLHLKLMPENNCCLHRFKFAICLTAIYTTNINKLSYIRDAIWKWFIHFQFSTFNFQLNMISVDGLTVEFGDRALFKDISFVINDKDRIALMGKNGAGKSTLLKVLAGERQPNRGNVSCPKDTVIAYLPQHLMTQNERTVFDETAQAFAHLFEMEKEIERLNQQLTERTDYDSPEYYKLIEDVSALSEKFYSVDSTHYEADVEKILLGLGFQREDFNRPTSDFSGGWRMRIELAKMLLKNPDVLLLDEPTNHLDIDSIQWLEDFLVNNGKAVVVISHDRAFVDNITTRTIEVTMGRIYDYKVNYSQYLVLRQDRRIQQQKAYDEQQKMIAETKEFIERFKGTYSKYWKSTRKILPL